jgi:hypothetical protein
MLLLAKAVLGIGATLGLAGAYVFHERVIRVDADESGSGGSHLHFFVPATTVPVGLYLMPQKKLQQVAEQMRPCLPALRELSGELGKYPDAELVDVRNGTEHIRIATRNGTVYVDAVTETDNVHVSFPAETLRDVADGLEDAVPGDRLRSLAPRARQG